MSPRGLILSTASWVWGKNVPSLAAPVAPGQLRDGRGREPPTIDSLQSLPAPLPGAETGSRQRCIFWETHPLHFHGTPHAAPRDEVTAFPSPSAADALPPLTARSFASGLAEGTPSTTTTVSG